jgi:hypothetical protein
MLALGNSARVKQARTALKTALNHSVGNFSLPGKTLVVADTSGSMTASISNHSSISRVELGILFAVVVAFASEEGDAWGFDTNVYNMDVNTDSSIISEVERLVRLYGRDGATYFDLVLKKLNTNKKKYDRVVVFSDMQVYEAGTQPGLDWCYSPNERNTIQLLWKKYIEYNPSCVLYSIDLAPYAKGTPISKKDGAVLIAGYSDKIIDLICNTNASNTLVAEIEVFDPMERKNPKDSHRDTRK